MNDTHPALGIVELLRVLVDEEGLDYEFAFGLVYKSFAYTNHTILPEALETWGVDLLGNLLPRHLELLYYINYIFMERVAKKYPGEFELMSKLSLVEESTPKKIRMANLSIIASHSVNGVAEIHSGLLKTNLFKHFYELYPNKFNNKTNGVTPRRWVRCCNPQLAELLCEYLQGDEWLTDMKQLKYLEKRITDK